MGMEVDDAFHRQHLWNDELLMAVGKQCPKLLKFSLTELDGGINNIPTPLNEITCAGVIALAKLPELRHVELKATRCRGRGIAALIQNAPISGLARVVEMDVGCLLLEGFIDDDEEPIVTFYDAVVDTLECLSRSPSATDNRRFHVTLMNRSRSDPDTPEWRKNIEHLAIMSRIQLDLAVANGRLESISFLPRIRHGAC